MSYAETVPAKYIFLDIVGYTKNRSVESQADIVGVLNQIVLESAHDSELEEKSRIYIPTGDGICIALLNATEHYDIHMSIALRILSSISRHNAQAPDEMRKFQVRMGINENTDNLVQDINGRMNLAGVGISTAQRIMNLGDGGQILVSTSVFETLRQRETYMGKFRSYDALGKHEQELRVHQYIEENHPGLNTTPPSKLTPRIKPEPKLAKLTAYYFAFAIKLRDFLLSHRGSGQNCYSLAQLLWYLAHDARAKSEATDVDNPYLLVPGLAGNNIEEKFSALQQIPFVIASEFVELMRQSEALSPWAFRYFEGQPGEMLFVNPAGREKLKKEWPDIWNEFGLN